MKIVILLLILLKHASTNNVWVIEPAVSSSSSSSLPPSSIENQIEQTQQEIEEKVEDYDESFIPKKKKKLYTIKITIATVRKIAQIIFSLLLSTNQTKWQRILQINLKHH